jgi:Flp pilus assembly protein TadG
MLMRAAQRMRRRVRGETADRGATMMLVTISMVMLLLFGAFAVDLGGAWSQRRENQAAVDTAGVAGALQTRGVDQATAIAQADVEIVRITYQSIAPNMTLAQWAAEWATCTDPAKGAEYTITGSSDCISYTGSLSKIRVQTPLVDTNTTFAGIIGLDTLQTDAAVEVMIALKLDGNVLPFGLPGGSSTATEICLKSGSNPNGIPPCDGPVDGNFGFLDISEYGNEELSTTTLCTGETNLRLARNTARGIDHPIVKAPNAAAPFRTDLAGCTSGNINYQPYSLMTDTGNKTGVLDAGFIDGIAGYRGALDDPAAPYTFNQGGKSFDDTPLSYYLNANGISRCETVLGVTAAPLPLRFTHDEMAMCLSSWTPGWGIIFNPGLQDASRFGWVPLFYGLTLGSGNTTLNIEEFRPVFIQTSFWKCNATSCDAIHDPSEPIAGSIGGTANLEAITAIQLPRMSLPANILDPFTYDDSNTLYAIIE